MQPRRILSPEEFHTGSLEKKSNKLSLEKNTDKKLQNYVGIHDFIFELVNANYDLYFIQLLSEVQKELPNPCYDFLENSIFSMSQWFLVMVFIYFV